MYRWLTVLMLLSVPVVAFAQDIPTAPETVVEKGEAWSVDYADWKCALNRKFLVDGKPAIFSLEREPLATEVSLRFADQGKARNAIDDKAVLFADGRQISKPVTFHVRPASGARIRDYRLDLAAHHPDAVKSSLRFWSRGNGDVEFRLGNFAAAWAALDTCRKDLDAALGIDAAAMAQIATQAEGDVTDFVKLPPANGGFEFAAFYWVDAAGRVDDCRLLLPSRRDALDKGFCSELKAKGRFKPARDAQGKAIRAPRYDHISILTATVIEAVSM